MNMRAKLSVSKVDGYPNTEAPTQTVLLFNAVGASQYPEDGTDENNTFARWTPNASLTMTIQNPNLVGTFKVGDTFYVDFTQCAEPGADNGIRDVPVARDEVPQEAQQD